MIHLIVVFVALRKYSIIKLLQSSVRLISLLHLAVIVCVICAVIFFLVKNWLTYSTLPSKAQLHILWMLRKMK